MCVIWPIVLKGFWVNCVLLTTMLVSVCYGIASLLKYSMLVYVWYVISQPKFRYGKVSRQCLRHITYANFSIKSFVAIL